MRPRTGARIASRGGACPRRLGALAAAAAHELGTPLATIAVVAKEMVLATPEGPLREDAELISSQAKRCREILHRLAETPEADDAVHARVSLGQLLELKRWSPTCGDDECMWS